MSRLKIVADNKIPFLCESPLSSYADIVYASGKEISKDMLKNADALIVRTRTRCNEELLAGTPVKFIATATIGFDHIDTKWCHENGILWKNAPGCNAMSVAQYIVSTLMNLVPDCKGMTVGIIGAGHVGSKVKAVLEILGLNVLVNDPPRADAEGAEGFEDLDFLLQKSQIVTMHVPLETAGKYPTFHLCNKDFFDKMQDDAVFINASRGEVMDTAALFAAKKSGKLSKIAIDVWENEPDISLDLLDIAEIATPHIAGYSLDGKANGTAMSAQAIAEFFHLPDLSFWHPEPQSPAYPLIDCCGSLQKAVLASYNSAADTAVLKEHPERFEKLRAEYPVRREFPAFTIVNAGENYKILQKLGFKC